ncbi:hypothetical protein HAX54_026698, partial [Datura stramonium]|nr:hypothetical protein [Datura stramonium]
VKYAKDRINIMIYEQEGSLGRIKKKKHGNSKIRRLPKRATHARWQCATLARRGNRKRFALGKLRDQRYATLHNTTYHASDHDIPIVVRVFSMPRRACCVIGNVARS